MKAKQHDDYQAQVAALSAIRQIVGTAEARRKEHGPADAGQIQAAQVKQQVSDGQADSKKTMEMVGAPPIQPLPSAPAQFEESKIADDWIRICEDRKRIQKQTNEQQNTNGQLALIDDGTAN